MFKNSYLVYTWKNNSLDWYGNMGFWSLTQYDNHAGKEKHIRQQNSVTYPDVRTRDREDKAFCKLYQRGNPNC